MNLKSLIILFGSMFLGLICACIVGEVVLQISSGPIAVLREGQSRDGIFEENVYRVLTVGDSLTAGPPYILTYPDFLEERLNERQEKLKVKVINKGNQGDSISKVLGKIHELLEVYKPQMVVMMLSGGEAFQEVSLTTSHSSGAKIFDSLLMVKDEWAARFGAYWASTVCFSDVFKGAKPDERPDFFFRELMRSSEPCDNNQYSNMFALPLTMKGLNEKAINLHEQVAKKYPKHFMARMELGRAYRAAGKIQQATVVHEEALSLNPTTQAYLELAYDYYLQQLYEKEEALLSEGISNAKNPFALYDELIRCLDAQGKTNEARSYKKAASKLHNIDYNEETRASFKELVEVLLQENIKVVVMQYPLREVTPLKEILKNVESKITIVSNQEPYFSALQKLHFSDLFRDLCGGDFGHPTFLGSNLIADHLANQILSTVQ